MMMPDFRDTDDVLEWAAQLIEEQSILDLAGVWARKKRDREDAELRRRVILETRRDCAKHIRAFKKRPELSALSVLRNIANLNPNDRHDMHLIDAWPLAWKGWLNIKCSINCNSNSIPPGTEYRIEITDKGKKVLAEAASSSGHSA